MTSQLPEKTSIAALFKRLPQPEKALAINELTDKQVIALNYDWQFWSRPEQRIPTHRPFITWLILAGRGWGKTRTGAEAVREWIKKYQYVNLIGATIDDARDIMIEGESGILGICPKHERPIYNSHKRRLEWPNGAKSLIFTADEPERLRGKQHMKIWCDELGAWRYIESWVQATLGLRLGDNPQAIITTTPKPLKVIKDLILDPTTIVTGGSTYDNKENLAHNFLTQIITRYEGTRLGRQELLAELLDDLPGAMWKRSDIDATRVMQAPDMVRIVVAIDPAVSTTEGADETGIVAVGKGIDGRWYVLADVSGKFSPDGWAREAIALYKRFSADRIIGEVNNGGDMIENTIRNIDSNVSYKAVRASKGKAVRAEPVAALYEQKRVSHVGFLSTLEDQMCIFTSDYNREKMKFSPDRMDALVWALTELAIEQNPGENILEYLRQQEAAALLKNSGSSASIKQIDKSKPIASQCDFDQHSKQN